MKAGGREVFTLSLLLMLNWKACAAVSAGVSRAWRDAVQVAFSYSIYCVCDHCCRHEGLCLGRRLMCGCVEVDILYSLCPARSHQLNETNHSLVRLRRGCDGKKNRWATINMWSHGDGLDISVQLVTWCSGENFGSIEMGKLERQKVDKNSNMYSAVIESKIQYGYWSHSVMHEESEGTTIWCFKQQLDELGSVVAPWYDEHEMSFHIYCLVFCCSLLKPTTCRHKMYVYFIALILDIHC